MRCPQCAFVTSDSKDFCPKCNTDLRPHKERLGIKAAPIRAAVVRPAAPAALPAASSGAAPGTQPGAVPSPKPAAASKPAAAGPEASGSWMKKIFKRKEAGAPSSPAGALELKEPSSPAAPSTSAPACPSAAGAAISSPVPAADAGSESKQPSPAAFAAPESVSLTAPAEAEEEIDDLLSALENLAADDGESELEMSGDQELDDLLTAISSAPSEQDDETEQQSMAGLFLEEQEQETADDGDEPRFGLSDADLFVETPADPDPAVEEPNPFAALSFEREERPAALKQPSTAQLRQNLPEVTPPVLEFGEDDDLLEQKLDEMIGDLVVKVQPVKQEPSKTKKSDTDKDLSLVIDDDLEISFEIELDDEVREAFEAAQAESNEENQQSKGHAEEAPAGLEEETGVETALQLPPGPPQLAPPAAGSKTPFHEPEPADPALFQDTLAPPAQAAAADLPRKRGIGDLARLEVPEQELLEGILTALRGIEEQSSQALSCAAKRAAGSTDEAPAAAPLAPARDDTRPAAAENHDSAALSETSVYQWLRKNRPYADKERLLQLLTEVYGIEPDEIAALQQQPAALGEPLPADAAPIQAALGEPVPEQPPEWPAYSALLDAEIFDPDGEQKQPVKISAQLFDAFECEGDPDGVLISEYTLPEPCQEDPQDRPEFQREGFPASAALPQAEPHNAVLSGAESSENIDAIGCAGQPENTETLGEPSIPDTLEIPAGQEPPPDETALEAGEPASPDSGDKAGTEEMHAQSASDCRACSLPQLPALPLEELQLLFEDPAGALRPKTENPSEEQVRAFTPTQQPVEPGAEDLDADFGFEQSESESEELRRLLEEAGAAAEMADEEQTQQSYSLFFLPDDAEIEKMDHGEREPVCADELPAGKQPAAAGQALTAEPEAPNYDPAVLSDYEGEKDEPPDVITPERQQRESSFVIELSEEADPEQEEIVSGPSADFEESAQTEEDSTAVIEAPSAAVEETVFTPQQIDEEAFSPQYTAESERHPAAAALHAAGSEICSSLEPDESVLADLQQILEEAAQWTETAAGQEQDILFELSEEADPEDEIDLSQEQPFFTDAEEEETSLEEMQLLLAELESNQEIAAKESPAFPAVPAPESEPPKAEPAAAPAAHCAAHEEPLPAPAQETAAESSADESDEIQLKDLLHAFTLESGLAPHLEEAAPKQSLCHSFNRPPARPFRAGEKEPAAVPEAFWDNTLRELQTAAAESEVEIGLNEIVPFPMSEKLSLLFEHVHQELRTPHSITARYDQVLKSEQRRVDNSDLKQAVVRYQVEERLVSARQRVREAQGLDVCAELEFAPLWRRMGAAIIDLGCAAAPALGLWWLSGVPAEVRQFITAGSISGWPAVLPPLLQILLLTYGLWLFLPLLSVTLTGQTIGGKIFGTAVVDALGRPAGVLHAAVRAFAQGATLLTLGIGLMPVFGKRRQTLHDKLARTFVIEAGEMQEELD